MRTAIAETTHAREELQSLRQLIEALAPRCGLDLKDRAASRRFRDGQAPGPGESIDPRLCEELRGMLILLLRLEGCSSEDIGFAGMQRLWQRHDDILMRFADRAITG